MNRNIILTTPEELKEIVQDAVSSLITKRENKKEIPDSMAIDKALELLTEQGCPTSRAKLYKLTSTGVIPHKKYGHKLVFSRKELLNWITSQCRVVGDGDNAVLSVARSARRKM